ncbi:TetR family transcriptional regulator [Nocardia neocaledoniensis]|uniref:TetR family transcriptional regulator n=1 Tax=Nocardia neocaledoniensis TaxID=236511 RepID=UPI0024554A36|nr:TetR family transcriptional regulator [Nocardia neocaledoniensis]
MRKTTSCAHCGREVIQAERGRARRYCSRSCQGRAYRARRDRRPPIRRARPARLTTVHIAATAVDVADRDGLDGLTMRRLARELGVATAALYRYFPDREALLDAMTELALDETPAPPPGADWRATLAAEAEAEWRLYRRHPWVLPVLARTRPPLGPTLFDSLERAFAALDDLDLSSTEMLTVYLAYSGMVQGLALMWSSDRGDRLGPSGGETLPAELAELLDPRVRPVLHRVFAGTPHLAELSFDELLTAGIGLLLDGVAVRHPSATE